MHQRWWWVWPTVAFAASRALLMMIPLGFVAYLGGTSVMNDVSLYARWAQILQDGTFPVGDQMWQYPPLIGPVLALGAAIPPTPEVGLMLVMLAFDVATFVVLMNACGRTGRTEAAWAWVLAGLAVGPVWLTRFDVIPALFAVLALLSVNRPLRAGLWMGIGAMLKVWPALLLLAVPRRGLLRALIGFAATSVALLVVLMASMPGATSFAGEQRSRGLQLESVPAWIFLLAHQFGWPLRSEYRYGAMEVVAEGTQLVAAIVTALTAIGLLAMVILRLTGRLERAVPADVALIVVLFTMITSRVLSPQYLVWVAAIAAVCLLSDATRMRPVILLLLPVPLLGQILYPMRYDLLTTASPPGLLIQSIRVGLLIAATAWGAVRLLRGNSRVDHVRVDSVEQVSETA